MSVRSWIALGAFIAASAARAELVPDPPIDCDRCAEWNRPQEPFRVFGNTYYVGTAELASILIATDDGLILLDGALPQSAALIDANIRALGFRTDDIRLIVSSHAHYDHVGGIAALQRASGAVVAASSASAAALRAAVSADGYRFTGSDTYPSIVDSFRESIRTVAALPCDILLSPHAGFFAMSSKLQQRREGRADAFVNGDDCRSYASAAGERLEQRIVEERAR